MRIESVGIGPHFDGTQLKEIATHPAKDHVMAVSKFELLPMIRPLLTFRMCRGQNVNFSCNPIMKLVVHMYRNGLKRTENLKHCDLP